MGHSSTKKRSLLNAQQGIIPGLPYLCDHGLYGYGFVSHQQGQRQLNKTARQFQPPSTCNNRCMYSHRCELRQSNAHRSAVCLERYIHRCWLRSICAVCTCTRHRLVTQPCSSHERIKSPSCVLPSPKTMLEIDRTWLRIGILCSISVLTQKIR